MCKAAWSLSTELRLWTRLDDNLHNRAGALRNISLVASWALYCVEMRSGTLCGADRLIGDIDLQHKFSQARGMRCVWSCRAPPSALDVRPQRRLACYWTHLSMKLDYAEHYRLCISAFKLSPRWLSDIRSRSWLWPNTNLVSSCYISPCTKYTVSFWHNI